MENSKLTDLEDKFCWVYACGPAPFNGNAEKTYDLVFRGSTGNLMRLQTLEVAGDGDDITAATELDVNSAIAARQLMMRDEIRDRIDEINSKNIVNAATLRPRLTENLLKIADECTVLTVRDRFGTPISPAALRAVAVNAISKLTDMYGIKEDIAHKVTLEGANGDGITFNLVMPEKNNDNEVSELLK
ncbi:MAG: hypothetical protein ACI4Q6_05935 [Huintestinicola sp.]